MATHDTGTIIEPRGEFVFKNDQFEVDASGWIAVILTVGVLMLLGKWLSGRRKNGQSANGNGVKMSTSEAIQQLSTKMDKIADSLGQGIDENRKQIQNVGEKIIRVETKTDELQSDMREARDDIKKLQADQAYLSGKVGDRRRSNGTRKANESR